MCVCMCMCVCVCACVCGWVCLCAKRARATICGVQLCTVGTFALDLNVWAKSAKTRDCTAHHNIYIYIYIYIYNK